MAAPGRRDEEADDDRPRLVAGKPYRFDGERLVKLGLENWERDGLQWPALDDHLLEPDQPWELVDGRLIAVPPAQDDHGAAHFNLTVLLGAHVSAGYEGFVDLTTRFGPQSNFAPDASVLPVYDPEHEARPLEELAFEIVSKQALSVSTTKARSMVARGGRRVFCLHLGRSRVLEWDRGADDWRELPREASIEDLCLVRPLEVAALLDTTRRDAAVVAALTARKVPELEAALDERERRGREAGRRQGRAEGKQEGVAQGKREALLGLLPEAEREALHEVTDLDELAMRVRHFLAGSR